MTRFEGECIHPYHPGECIRYVCAYHFNVVGIAYEVSDVFDGKLTLLESGVLTWGIHAFPPRRRLQKIIQEGIGLVNMEMLRASRSAT